MKKFIAGFLVGAILFSLAPVSAAIEEFICYRADYKVIVNGSEYINTDLPILTYKGNTYAPFRSILEKAGLNVAWNAELGQAEVTSNPTSAQINNVEGTTMSTTATTIEYDPVSGLPVGAEYTDNEKDGKKYKTVSYNGNIYISSVDLKGIYEIEQGNLDVKSGIRTLYKNNITVEINLRSSDYFNANARSYYKIALLESLMGE